MNKQENILRYLGFAILLGVVVARVQHYVEAQNMTSFVVFGGVLIISAYQRYARRLQQRCHELEQQQQPSLPARHR